MQQELISFRLKDGRNIEIRSPRSDEAALILAAMVDIAASSPYILSTPEDFKNRSMESQMKWLQESAESDSAIVIASYFEGKLVGLCDARCFKDEKRKHRASLGISVSEPFRSSGLGRKMTEALLENMKKFKGIKIIELDVMSANLNAIKLYESFGFKRAGVFPEAFILPSGETLDNISMFIKL